MPLCLIVSTPWASLGLFPKRGQFWRTIIFFLRPTDILRVGMTSPGQQFETALSLASHPQPIQFVILITLISVPVSMDYLKALWRRPFKQLLVIQWVNNGNVQILMQGVLTQPYIFALSPNSSNYEDHWTCLRKLNFNLKVLNRLWRYKGKYRHRKSFQNF